MLQPKFKTGGFFYDQNHEALKLWRLVSQDRVMVQGPTPVPTPTITDICRTFGATRGVFFKIKMIEGIHYSALLKQHAEAMDEVSNKGKSSSDNKKTST